MNSATIHTRVYVSTCLHIHVFSLLSVMFRGFNHLKCASVFQKSLHTGYVRKVATKIEYFNEKILIDAVSFLIKKSWRSHVALKVQTRRSYSYLAYTQLFSWQIYLYILKYFYIFIFQNSYVEISISITIRCDSLIVSAQQAMGGGGGGILILFKACNFKSTKAEI